MNLYTNYSNLPPIAPEFIEKYRYNLPNGCRLMRGHFRNQAHGPKMTERKIIWVRPYLKGRERVNEKMPMRRKEYTVHPHL